jgi:hypothetical protein
MSRVGHNRGPNIDPYRHRLHKGADGWIRVDRRIRDHWLVGFGLRVNPMDETRPCLNRSEAWLDLIMECRYEAGTIMNGGHKMQIMPGQLVGAVSWLAHRWNWTPKTVRWWLDKLAEDEMISFDHTTTDRGKQNGKQAQVITICKYSEYQDANGMEGQTERQEDGKRRANEGQTNGNTIKDNKGNKGNKGNKENNTSSPPAPHGGVPAQSALPLQDGEIFTGDPEPAKAEKSSRDVVEAFELYNKAARHYQFAVCQGITEGRKTRMARRLKDIGGLENFKQALRALARVSDPFVKFLRGKAPSRPGEEAFRLDVDRLLQTDGKLGDVLAKLFDLDVAIAAADAPPVWKTWTRDEWVSNVREHANGIWPPNKIGYWPGHPKAEVPPDVVAELGLDGKYDHRGLKIR